MRIAGRLFATLVVFGLVAPAFAVDRSADEIVKEITTIPQPKTFAEFQAGNTKRAELVGELQKSHPDDARLAKFLPARWMALSQSNKGDEALAEIEKTIAVTKDDTLKKSASYIKVQVLLMKGPASVDAALKAIDEFAKMAPGDPRTAPLLYSASTRMAGDEAKKTALEDRILKDFGDSQVAGMVKGARKQREAVGKPFDLEFTEAIKGSNISIKGLKGKVVVIDFWATWCGPCVAEMPKMKTLYSEYKDKGVEFIGVSLDQPKEAGGLDKLKAFVADKEIPWPQYYQGKGWESDFSRSWGINSIPCVFIVDADGKLATVEARGKLDKLIPELLKRAKSTPGAE